jgi:hypothetical protein
LKSHRDRRLAPARDRKDHSAQQAVKGLSELARAQGGD